MKFPVIGTINTFLDVRKALQDIRDYFTATPAVGNVVVTQPPTSATLTIVDGKELKATESWELGKVYGDKVGQVLDTTQLVEVTIAGHRVKLAVLK